MIARGRIQECLTEQADLAKADEGAAKGGEGLVDVGPAFVAHGKVAVAAQPGVGALDNPSIMPWVCMACWFRR